MSQCFVNNIPNSGWETIASIGPLVFDTRQGIILADLSKYKEIFVQVKYTRGGTPDSVIICVGGRSEYQGLQSYYTASGVSGDAVLIGEHFQINEVGDYVNARVSTGGYYGTTQDASAGSTKLIYPANKVWDNTAIWYKVPNPDNSNYTIAGTIYITVYGLRK